MTEALKQLRHAFFILLISIIDFKQDKESMPQPFWIEYQPIMRIYSIFQIVNMPPVKVVLLTVLTQVHGCLRIQI